MKWPLGISPAKESWSTEGPRKLEEYALAVTPVHHRFAGIGRPYFHTAHLIKGRHELLHLVGAACLKDQVKGVQPVQDAVPVNLDSEFGRVGLGYVL